MAYLSGLFVEREKKENSVYFAIGICAGIAVHDTCGSLWLINALYLDPAEAYMKGAGIFLGLHTAHGMLAVLIASSASTTIRSEGKK